MLFDEVTDGGELPIFNKLSLIRLPIRLGEDAFVNGVISQEKEDSLIEMAYDFVHLCSVFKIDKHCATATSAMRSVTNGEEIISKVKAKTGIQIDIIPGEEEAEVLGQSIFSTGNLDEDLTYMFIDVGGGSTEVNFVSNGERRSWRSFNLGAVRLKEGIQNEDEWGKFPTWIKEEVVKYSPEMLVGIGGNIVTTQESI
ncbi:MAG: hypothetical protein GY816_17940 [Cytophagales bacterium]|nr:hypothetical protein [Cytophagales bacterium]